INISTVSWLALNTATTGRLVEADGICELVSVDAPARHRSSSPSFAKPQGTCKRSLTRRCRTRTRRIRFVSISPREQLVSIFEKCSLFRERVFAKRPDRHTRASLPDAHCSRIARSVRRVLGHVSV